MELFVYYILPNVALFGSIYIVAKAAEHSAWYVIQHYDNLVAQLEDYFVDTKRKWSYTVRAITDKST